MELKPDMKILIVGDGNSIHILNYIKVVLGDFYKVDITLFDMNPGKQINEEVYDYYREKNIKVVSNNGFNHLVQNNFFKKVPKIKVAYYVMKLNKKIKSLGKFDYCILHSINRIKAFAVVRNYKKYKRIIPVFWGSDILRNRKLQKKSFTRLFQISYKIIFNTENMKIHFKSYFENKFDAKSEIIKFPTLSFEHIDKIEKNNTITKLKANLKLPLDKYIIMCGHAGNKAEQHESLINAISKCKKTILEKCHFIFPMTYGEKDLIEQQKHVISLLENKGIQGEVLCDYLNNDEFLKISICADIFINVIKTDAFSSVMQENLYSNSYVIYGDWLNYYELEDSGIIAKSVEKVSDVTNILEKTITNYNTIKTDLAINKDLISDISSPTTVKYLWRRKVFTNDY